MPRRHITGPQGTERCPTSPKPSQNDSEWARARFSTLDAVAQSVQSPSNEAAGPDAGWVRRLQGIHTGLTGGAGFPKPVAGYLGDKYGDREEDAPQHADRVAALLVMLAERLHAQQKRGSEYYSGDSLSALDIYSATFMALIKPLPAEQCPMAEALRPAFEAMDNTTRAALDPILLAHRDAIYAQHLELPPTL